ncbi:MAG: anhydro-N-acetylmuramic acid kinase [Bdellovibrionaceae bacterium]|nr:anhydro-N-acetylmuramic acid kinase [Pseudobdellovibrionaceae bacterium]
MIILGIMSGTSADGVDYVWINLEVHKELEIQFLHQEHRTIPKNIKTKIEAAITNKLTTYDLSLLNYDIGKMYASHFKSFKAWKKKTQLIGMHGQTIFHEGQRATWQIGEPTFLSLEAQAPVIFNFRAGDVALGGHGAPLAPIFHKALLGSPSHPTGFHNLGGISNITYVCGDEIRAFDTGPANTLLDVWLQHKTRGTKKFDKDGKIAARGLPHVSTVQKFLKTPYLQQKPPKSTGRELYNLNFIKKQAPKEFFKLSLEDQMATLTDFTVLSIRMSYDKFLPQELQSVYFSGGGTQNTHLMKRLRMLMPEIKVGTSKDLGWPESAIEGATFALLAFLRVQEQKIHLEHITGNKKPALLGQICGE